MSKLIVTVIHYSVFFYYCKHIGYVFIVSLNVSTHYQHLVFFYKRATMHGKWRVIYRPIFILSLLYRYSCPSVLNILYQLMSEPPRVRTYVRCCAIGTVPRTRKTEKRFAAHRSADFFFHIQQPPQIKVPFFFGGFLDFSIFGISLVNLKN